MARETQTIPRDLGEVKRARGRNRRQSGGKGGGQNRCRRVPCEAVRGSGKCDSEFPGSPCEKGNTFCLPFGLQGARGKTEESPGDVAPRRLLRKERNFLPGLTQRGWVTALQHVARCLLHHLEVPLGTGVQPRPPARGDPGPTGTQQAVRGPGLSEPRASAAAQQEEGDVSTPNEAWQLPVTARFCQVPAIRQAGPRRCGLVGLVRAPLAGRGVTRVNATPQPSGGRRDSVPLSTALTHTGDREPSQSSSRLATRGPRHTKGDSF